MYICTLCTCTSSYVEDFEALLDGVATVSAETTNSFFKSPPSNS